MFSDDVINAAAPVPEVGKTGASDEWIGNSMENYITVAFEGTDGSIPFSDLTWNFLGWKCIVYKNASSYDVKGSLCSQGRAHRTVV